MWRYFTGLHLPPLVPDMFLSLDVRVGDEDWWLKENRSYFIWVHGKPPDVVVEVVSNEKGGELDRKMREYAWMGIPYYVVYDPEPVSIPIPAADRLNWLRANICLEPDYRSPGLASLCACGMGCSRMGKPFGCVGPLWREI